MEVNLQFTSSFETHLCLKHFFLISETSDGLCSTDLFLRWHGTASQDWLTLHPW